jgi:exodeoxyribonuclease III
VSETAPVQAGEVRLGIGEKEGDGEGRVMTVALGAFQLVNVYTPNSGEGLKRLGYRVGVWDRAFAEYLRRLHDEGLPVVCVGDLNVAHRDEDFFNPGEPRMAKAAGTTPEERASFGEVLTTAGMYDTFRSRHPEAKGVYSYWSMRSANRPWNRGLRLDYVVASEAMRGEGPGPRVVDALILDDCMHTNGFSDHAVVGAVIALDA